MRAELRWLADALAPVRDLDVLSDHLNEEVVSLDAGDAVTGARLLEPLEERRQLAGETLQQVLESDRYLELLDRIAAAAVAPPVRRAHLSFRKRVRREFRKLDRQVRALGETPSAAALHKARIRGKRARYAAELASGGDSKASRRFVDALKTFQDVLGEHQDAVDAGRELRVLACVTQSHEAALVAGRLIERQHERATAARAEFRDSWKHVRRARP